MDNLRDAILYVQMYAESKLNNTARSFQRSKLEQALRVISQELEHGNRLKESPPPMKKLIYLASPYSSQDDAVREHRFKDACCAAATLINAGLFVFSPIAHTHPIIEHSGLQLPHGWDYWHEYDKQILSQCYLMIVLQIDGWDKSTGIQGEIEICNRMSIPYHFAKVDDLPDLALRLVTGQPIAIG